MSEQVRRFIEHVVYTRVVDPLLGPKVNGETTGWVYDPNLRCRHVTHRVGANPGEARFDYISLDNKPTAIEDVLNSYHPDTQVRVELFPYDSAQGNDTPDEQTGLVVFEGVLERQSAQVQAVGTQSRERASMIAVALPWIDNRAVVHQVTGRWMHVFLTNTWDRIESPSLPAAFNHRGRANMDPDDTHKKTAAPGSGPAINLTARPFTHDDDPDGKHWTVREALKSILVQWLYGETLNARDRVIGVEADTLAALEAEAVTEDRFKGLDDVLPETDVSGLFALEAIQAVCRAGGFEFASEPVIDAANNDTSTSDRRYALRLWRRHTGTAKDLMLPKRGQYPSDPAEKLKRVNTQKVTVLRDNAGIVNHVFARGRVLIECAVELRPLWKPDDIEAEKKDNPSEGFKPAPATNQLPVGAIPASAYHSKHVQGGSQFAEFGHVGRVWGLDCTGAASIAEAFYITDPYQHAPAGFDWLGMLGIPTGAGEGEQEDKLTAERTARHIDAATDPIVWTNRLRRPLPLRRAEAVDTDRRFILEVSETLPKDEMGTPQPENRSWTEVTRRVSFTTLRDFFGIRLTGVSNLASVNAATLSSDNVPAIADSWWQKMLDEELLFRLTCLVESDHAAIYRADRQATSGTVYSRGALIDLDLDEVWSHKSSALNPSNDWQKVAAAPGSAADATDQIKGAAERTRDAHEGTRYSATSDNFLLEAQRWRVGDRVRGVVGRGISFATNAGAEQRHPTVHEVRMVLSPGKAQGVFLSLNDTKLRRGV